jgi:F-type H+-transporting ATPase subunit epsilon
MPSFHLQIISPQRVEFDGDVESLVAPGEDGYLGVLANHAPLLTTLKDGSLTFRPHNGGAGAKERYRVSGGGFLEVHRNKVIVLANQVSKGS